MSQYIIDRVLDTLKKVDWIALIFFGLMAVAALSLSGCVSFWAYMGWM